MRAEADAAAREDGSGGGAEGERSGTGTPLVRSSCSFRRSARALLQSFSPLTVERNAVFLERASVHMLSSFTFRSMSGKHEMVWKHFFSMYKI